MVDQSTCLGLDLFCISPDSAFLTPLFNKVCEATLKLLCPLLEVSEKPAECWAWELPHVAILLLVWDFG